jgi:hypothetical protein
VPKSTLTADWFKAKLKAVGGSGTNKRRHAAAWSSCLTYLVEDGKLERNPLDDVTLPKNNKTQPPHIDAPRGRDPVREHVRPGRTARPRRSARAPASSCRRCSTRAGATSSTRRTASSGRTARRTIPRSPGRRRRVGVEDHHGYVKAARCIEDAPLFPGVTERSHRAEVYRVRDELRAQGVNIPANYKPHNCRNTFAVRGMREGRDPILLANNLGHSDTSEVTRRYGKYRPAITDLVRADQRGKPSRRKISGVS